MHHFKLKHRIEVKNVKIRERATRGLLFDGDSLFGFFDDESEFTESNVEKMYFYTLKDVIAIPPTLNATYRSKFKVMC
jgi:hypothetical protein